VTKQKYKR